MTKSIGLTSPSLWRNRAFIRLWLAQILSNTGTQITNIALPLTAILALDATPAQMGLLGIAGSLPNLLFGLFMGVWVDRTRRAPLLVGADTGRALLLGSIPVAVLLGYLTFGHLVVVVFASATLTVLFTIASVSVLPSLVKGEQLIEANSKLAFSDSLLGIAGPGAAGGLIQLVSAPKAIIFDAISYLLSALFLRGLTPSESPSRPSLRRRALWGEIGEGIHELVRTPLLRALTASASVGSLGGGIQQPVLLLFLTHSLGLSPVLIGLVFAWGSAGALLGSAFAGQLARRIGVGPAITLGTFLWALGNLMIPLAGLLANPPLLGLGLSQLFAGLGAALFGVNQMSLRQRLTPVELFGRTTAARRFLIFGLAAAGAALGGLLGGAFGLRLTLLVGAVGFTFGFLLLFFSPVRRINDLSGTVEFQ